MTKGTETKDLAVPGASDALSSLLQQMAAQAELKPAPMVLKRLTVYVPGKFGTDKGANRGFILDYLDNENYEVNIESMNIYRLDVPVFGRIMWPFDAADGKKLQGEKYRDPWCGSSDGITPRTGERANYIGQSYVDYRDGQEHTIPAKCNDCPFGAWMPLYDKEGQAIMERDRKGVLRNKRGKPPCNETPKVPLFDLDGKRTLLMQTRGYMRNLFFLGGWSNHYGYVKGINDFYNIDPKTGRPPIVDADGKIHALKMTVKNVDTGGFGLQPVPTFEIGDVIADDVLVKLNEHMLSYKQMNGRAIISGQAFADASDEEAHTNVPANADELPF